MTLTLDIPESIRAKLDAKARAVGLDIPAYAEKVLAAEALIPSLDVVLAPIRESFQKSGMTVDEVAEQYEKEKHAGRAGKRKAGLGE